MLGGRESLRGSVRSVKVVIGWVWQAMIVEQGGGEAGNRHCLAACIYIYTHIRPYRPVIPGHNTRKSSPAHEDTVDHKNDQNKGGLNAFFSVYQSLH